jgi:carbonic anhydrase
MSFVISILFFLISICTGEIKFTRVKLAIHFQLLFRLASRWSYSENSELGPNEWPTLFENCNAKNAKNINQSPININWSELMNGGAPLVTISNSTIKFSNIIYQNALFAFQIGLDPSSVAIPTISGGPLGSNRYRVSSIHLKWPSEHTLNYYNFDAEIQITALHSNFSNFFEAVKQKDGAAILSVMMHVRLHDRKLCQVFLNLFILNRNQTTIIIIQHTFDHSSN